MHCRVYWYPAKQITLQDVTRPPPPRPREYNRRHKSGMEKVSSCMDEPQSTLGICHLIHLNARSCRRLRPCSTSRCAHPMRSWARFFKRANGKHKRVWGGAAARVYKSTWGSSGETHWAYWHMATPLHSAYWHMAFRRSVPTFDTLPPTHPPLKARSCNGADSSRRHRRNGHVLQTCQVLQSVQCWTVLAAQAKQQSKRAEPHTRVCEQNGDMMNKGVKHSRQGS
jgi:hypothetical protein